MIIRYGERVTEILADLNPVEKDVYIKKISEETGLREQSIYDMISDKITRNTESMEILIMNRKKDQEENRILNLLYIKGREKYIEDYEDDSYFKMISENIRCRRFRYECHKELYELIRTLKEKNDENLQSKIELKCQNPILKNGFLLRNLYLLHEREVASEINDYIYQIKKFKLEEQAKNIIMILKN